MPKKLSPHAKLLVEGLDRRYPRMLELFHGDVVRALVDATVFLAAFLGAPPDAHWPKVKEVADKARKELYANYELD